MATRAPRRRFKPDERGVAMLMAVVAITVLTIVATEFAFNSRVDLQMATNERDEVRAYYMARSGVGMARLLLKFQKQLDSMNLGSMLGGLGGLLGGGAATTAPGATNTSPAAAAAGAGSNPLSSLMPGMSGGLNIQLWKMAKIDCHMLQGLVTEDPGQGPNNKLAVSTRAKSRSKPKALDIDTANPELAAKQAAMSFGGFQGCFDAKISPEEPKLNLNKLDMPQFSSQVVVARLLDMFSDKRFEFLFLSEDANRVKTTPQDLVIALHDWMDDDTTQSTLNLTGQGEPFLKGFADEAYFYDRYNPRYLPKNARFDTLDELYMVHGWNDRMMAAYRDRLTVYPDINTPPNINTDDPLLLYMAILSVMDPLHPDTRLQNPLFVDALIKQIRGMTLFSFMGMSASDFVSAVQMSGIAVNPAITANMGQNRFISDKNQTYTITSVGEAGTVTQTITAVVRMDDQNIGRLLFWKEQ
jgi:general secretion pathway protein K